MKIPVGHPLLIRCLMPSVLWSLYHIFCDWVAQVWCFCFPSIYAWKMTFEIRTDFLSDIMSSSFCSPSVRVLSSDWRRMNYIYLTTWSVHTSALFKAHMSSLWSRNKPNVMGISNFARFVFWIKNNFSWNLKLVTSKNMINVFWIQCNFESKWIITRPFLRCFLLHLQ